MALKDIEKEFNSSLLDEQAKKIKDLEEKNKKFNTTIMDLSRELSAERFTNKVIAKKNKKIASLKNSIKEKDEVIDDISEELRLSKEREEELIATVKDYLALVGDKDEEIKKLKKKLAKCKRVHFVKQKFMPYGAQYRDNHNFVVTEKPRPDIVIVKAPF